MKKVLKNNKVDYLQANLCGLKPPAKCARAQIYYNTSYAESSACQNCGYRISGRFIYEKKDTKNDSL